MSARLLAIMGSGETTPTMAKVHRHILSLLGPEPGPAVLVGTPFGFQANAAEISARAVSYFRQSVGLDVSVVPMRKPTQESTTELQGELAQVASARWLFSGPGSPTYAIRQWRVTPFADLLADKLSYGGAVVFSSAAAMALGRWSVPVYEVYKVGADVTWADGLDVLGRFGLNVAVVAHFDNAEGGTHDTRYCYLGEPRLRVLEGQLPEDGWVLGVDEHTACIINFETGALSVLGLGAVTVRVAGRSSRFTAGQEVTLESMVSLARSLRTVPETAASFGGDAALISAPVSEAPVTTHDEGPFMAQVREINSAFDQALHDRDGRRATEAVFALEDLVREWGADTTQSDQTDRARATLHRMLARLGELASVGLRDPRSVVEPWVSALMGERDQARSARRFADSDRVRATLARLGVEVHDTPDGSQWQLRPDNKG